MTVGSLATWVAGQHPDAPPLPIAGVVDALRLDTGAVWSADEVGRAYERTLVPATRQAAGAYYTPRDVAEGVVALALPGPERTATVLDPAVGGGAFLLAAARRLERTGLPRRRIVERCLHGLDIDQGALEAAAVALALWAGPDADGWADARPHLHLVDAIASPPDALLERLGVGGFTAVVGNPPYLGQLRARTARTRDHAARVATALPGAGGAYTDAATLFLLMAVRLLVPGGRAALLVPESVLSARDAAGVRAAVLAEAALEHLWVAGEPVFTASARVCSPVLHRDGGAGADRGPVGRSVGRAFQVTTPGVPPARTGQSWGHLLAGLHGVPTIELTSGGGVLGDRAEVTAGFRQQFYGVQPFVVDAIQGEGSEGWPRLVTSGSIDPLVCHWGNRPITFARRRWDAPVIDLEAVQRADPSLHRWALDRLHPKVVVATQTRVIEAAVDVEGRWYPSTPTVAVTPREGELWMVAAVLCAPPVAAWLHGRLAGSALAAGHLRVTAGALRQVPWPADGTAVVLGAELAEVAATCEDGAARRRHLLSLGLAMTEAYGAPRSVYDWWVEHLPSPRPAGGRAPDA
jgi:hypothetical protein